jgi:hypothetical protein
LLLAWALPPARSACPRWSDIWWEVIALKEAGVNAAYNFLMKPVPDWPRLLMKNLKVK